VKRVVVIGSTGSGKSTFARALAAELGVPYTDADDLFWTPGWVEVDLDTFRRRLAEAVAGDEWVLAGNYFSRSVDVTWPRADTVVWLDLPLPLVLYRSVSRTVRRSITKEVICNGNTERLRNLLPARFTGEKPLWAFAIAFKARQHPRIAQFVLDHPHVEMHRLRSRAEVATFLREAA
jgi:adenylate kinase family enzyme